MSRHIQIQPSREPGDGVKPNDTPEPQGSSITAGIQSAHCNQRDHTLNSDNTNIPAQSHAAIAPTSYEQPFVEFREKARGRVACRVRKCNKCEKTIEIGPGNGDYELFKHQESTKCMLIIHSFLCVHNRLHYRLQTFCFVLVN